MLTGLQLSIRSSHITVVGTGGTGGLLVRDLAMLLYGLKNGENHRLEIPVTLCEGDLVEPKNLFRQPFIGHVDYDGGRHGDIDRNKAIVLSERYGTAYGLKINAYDKFIEDEVDDDNNVKPGSEILKKILLAGAPTYSSNFIPILIDCVDNNFTRKNYIKPCFDSMDNIIFISSGNDEFTGQVVCAFKHNGKVMLPPVWEVYPDMFNEVNDFINRPGACSEKVVSNPQNLQTNLMASTIIRGYLNNILARNELTTYMHTFSAKTGQIRPFYIDSAMLPKDETAEKQQIQKKPRKKKEKGTDQNNAQSPIGKEIKNNKKKVE